MHDKVKALNVLARCVGLDERHVSESSLEEWARRMSREERLARIEELRAKTRAALHGQQQAQLAAVLPVVGWALVVDPVAANDNDNTDERQSHSPGDLTVVAPAGS